MSIVRWLAGAALLAIPTGAWAQTAPAAEPAAPQVMMFDKPVGLRELELLSHTRAECLGGLPPVPGLPAVTMLFPCDRLTAVHRVLLQDKQYDAATRPVLQKRSRMKGLEAIYADEEMTIAGAAAGAPDSMKRFDTIIARRAAFPEDRTGLRDAQAQAAQAALEFADLSRAEKWAQSVAYDNNAGVPQRAESLIVLAQVARYRDRREEALHHIDALFTLKPAPLGQSLAAGGLRARIAIDEFDIQGALLGFMRGLIPVVELIQRDPDSERFAFEFMSSTNGMVELVDGLSEVMRNVGGISAKDQMNLLTLVDGMDKDQNIRRLMPRGWKAPLLLRSALSLADLGQGTNVIEVCRRAQDALSEATSFVRQVNALNLARCDAQVARFSGDLAGASTRLSGLLQAQPSNSPQRIELLREAAIVASEAGEPQVATDYAGQAVRAVETRLRQQANLIGTTQRYRETFLTAVAIEWKASH